MSERNKDLVYIVGIVLMFLLLAFITWLVYDYQIHRIDNSKPAKPGITSTVAN